jgi:hypothetical protein
MRLARSGATLKTEADIVGDIEMRKQSALLRDDADTALVRRHGCGSVGQQFAVQRHPSDVRLLETGDDTQQGRLARAGRADDGGAAAGGNIERDVFQRLHMAVALADAGDREQRHCPAVRFD